MYFVMLCITAPFLKTLGIFFILLQLFTNAIGGNTLVRIETQLLIVEENNKYKY